MKRIEWLLLDMHYLCYRAHYAHGDLSFEGEPTAAIFGVLKDIKVFQERFNCERLVFCFDHGKGLREQAHTFYKEKRRKRVVSDEQAESLEGMKSQVEKLKYEYLDKMGFSNVFFQKGYEADDAIASVVHNLDDREKAIIISADKDLYQLLWEDRVRMYNPASGVDATEKWFRKNYGIAPSVWATVKALAGCSSDNIPGIAGVGEKTAIQYVRKELKRSHHLHGTIEKFIKSPDFVRNLSLVTLPYAGCNNFVPVEDSGDTDVGLELLAERLGMESLIPNRGGRGARLGG